MSSNTSSHFMRRLVALKSSRQSRKQPLSDIASPASPTGFPFETAHPTLPEPLVTYHTNFLGLFATDGETPIAATVPPKLTDLVPPMEETSTPRASEHSRAPRVIEDFDYVGGWVSDDDGKHQYIPRGHIEEIEEQGSNYGPVAGPSRFADAMSLPVSTTPPPRPSLRTKRELPQSPLVPDGPSRFHHSRLTSTPHTPARFPTSLSQSLSSLPPLRGFPPQPTNTGYFSPEEFHQPVSNNGAEALADSLSTLPPLHGFPLQPDYIGAEFNTLPQPFDVTAVQIEPLADSLSTLPSLHGFQHFTPRTERISEENLTFEFADIGSDHATGAFESLGDIESLPPQKEPSPSPVAQEPMEPMPWIQLLTEPIIVPLYHSTGNDERMINQIISSIKEISKTVKIIQSGVSSLKHVRNVQPHLMICEHIEKSLFRVEQTLLRQRTLPQEHWSHLSVSSRSRYESRLSSLQRCLRRLSDLSKRIVEPSKLDLLFKKLRQHHEKLTNIADKFDDTFERLKLRHLYTVASKLTEEANRNRSTYMSAREMYLHKKGRGKRPRASRPQPSATAH
ncbi:hypothetical protein F5050DRAFT_1713253 [Lentinula boryana]|uniref:Uncharacterized protein n=1 Tax=Lentinula boryana TaxID=40481 RepID=A0ABQ8Q8Y6_9AGAR|nr:hypothetical protein F5050DRAFT_1713253 [Lentinula boryana]